MAPAQQIAIAEYSSPTANSDLGGITTGPDGALWFTEYLAGKIGRINVAGAITEYPVADGAGSGGLEKLYDHPSGSSSQ